MERKAQVHLTCTNFHTILIDSRLRECVEIKPENYISLVYENDIWLLSLFL